MGSLSICQQIFLTRELNQGLQHHRQILYQLATREAHYNYFLKIQGFDLTNLEYVVPFWLSYTKMFSVKMLLYLLHTTVPDK